MTVAEGVYNLSDFSYIALMDKNKLHITSIDTRPFARDERASRPRIYFFPEGATLRENLRNRHDRPHKVYREFLPEVLRSLGLPEDAKVSWSQKAGCPCGCSPAFIVKDPRLSDYRRHVYVTLSERGA